MTNELKDAIARKLGWERLEPVFFLGEYLVPYRQPSGEQMPLDDWHPDRSHDDFQMLLEWMSAQKNAWKLWYDFRRALPNPYDRSRLESIGVFRYYRMIPLPTLLAAWCEAVGIEEVKP